jgi:hypothetical protein
MTLLRSMHASVERCVLAAPFARDAVLIRRQELGFLWIDWALASKSRSASSVDVRPSQGGLFMTSNKLIALLALGTMMTVTAGCAANADANAGPKDPSSTPPSGGSSSSSTTTNSASPGSTGSTSSALSTGSSSTEASGTKSGASPSTATSPAPGAPATTGVSGTPATTTTPATTSTTPKDAKKDKDNPGHPDSGAPGVGNQRKSDGTQPGTVGQGPSSSTPPAKKDDGKKDDGKKK